MGCNRLRLNVDKTQVIWMETRQQLGKIGIDARSSSYCTLRQFKSAWWSIWASIVLDNQLKMSEQVSIAVSLFLFLPAASNSNNPAVLDVRFYKDTRECLDYCNSLLYGIGEGLIDRLQRVQNAAARLVSGAKKYDHITPIMMDLHWLPIRRRVTFKVATLVYKMAPWLMDQTMSLFSFKKHLKTFLFQTQ